MFYQQNQKFGFRKSKAYRTLCGALLGTFLVLAVQTASADEVTDSTTQSQPQVETVAQPVTAEAPVTSSAVTTESANVTTNVTTKTPVETPAVTTNVTTVEAPATTENMSAVDSNASQYVSTKARETAEKTFSKVDTSKPLTSDDIKAPDNLTDSQNAVLDSVKEGLDALPANVRSVAKSVTVVDENDGSLGYTASISGKVNINAHYFDANNADESIAVLYHEIGHTIDGATYDRASDYSLSRDEAVQPLLKTAYPGQPNYEAFASLFGTYMLQETGQKAISTAVDMEIKKYFDTVLKGFTTPKSDSITRPLLKTVDTLRANGRVLVFDGMNYMDSADKARDLNNKTIARLTNTRRARSITSPVTHFAVATVPHADNVTVTMTSNTQDSTTNSISTFNNSRIHEVTVNVSGTGEVPDNSYIDVTVETNVPSTDSKNLPLVDNFNATNMTEPTFGGNTEHAKLTLTGIAAGIQKGFTIQVNSLNDKAPLTSTVTRKSTYKLVVDGKVLGTKVVTETLTADIPAVTKAENIQTFNIVKDGDTGTTNTQYIINQSGELAVNNKRAYGVVDIQVPKNVVVTDDNSKSFESYKVIDGDTAHYLIPQNDMPRFVSTNAEVDTKALVATNPSAKRLEQTGKVSYYYSDTALTNTLDGLKNVPHIDKDFKITTQINTVIQQKGSLDLVALLGKDRVNVLNTDQSNYYSMQLSNGGPSSIRQEVPLTPVELDFNRDDKPLNQGNYEVEGSDSVAHPYNVYNAETNEFIGTIQGGRLALPKAVSRIRIEPKNPMTVGYGPTATVRGVIYNVFFKGTDTTAKAWKQSMDQAQRSDETTRFDAKLLNSDLTVSAQKNSTLTITNEFIGTRLLDNSYVFFTPSVQTQYVPMPLLVTNSLRGNLSTNAIDKIEIKDPYGIIGHTYNRDFRASDNYVPISLLVDNAGDKVDEVHRANIGNFVDTVYNAGPRYNTYIGLTTQLPAGIHIYDIPVRLTMHDGVSVINKDGSTSTSNVTEATLHIITYDSKVTGTESSISSGTNSGTNIKIPNVDNGLVATTYVNNFTESDVNQMTAMSYIPKAGIEGSTANTSLKSAVTAPAGWKVMYTTGAVSGNYKTDRNLNFTDSVTDYSKVTALKFVSTGTVKATTATPFNVPLNFEGTPGHDTVNYRSVLLTGDGELLSTPVTARPTTGNIVYEYRMLFGKDLIKSEGSGDKFVERTENYTFGGTITDSQGRKYHRVEDHEPNTVSTVVKEGTTTITRYYLANNVTTVTIKYELDMNDEATKLASEGGIGMPHFNNGVLGEVNNPESILRLEDPMLLVGDRIIQAGERTGFSPNHYKAFNATPDINHTGKDVVLDYTRLSVTTSPDLKDLFDNYVKTDGLVDMEDTGVPKMMVEVTGTNAENSHATITYYYKVRSGSITQHFVDEQGNKIADDTTTGKLVADASVVNVAYPSVITKDGATYNYVRNTQTGTLTPSTLGHLTQVGTGTNVSTVLSPTGDVGITYVYKKETKDVIIRHLVDRTDKVTEDYMTYKIYAPDLSDTDVQSKGILKPETRQTINKDATVTVTDPGDKTIVKDSDFSQTGRPVTFTYARKTVTQDGDNTIISYYYTVDRGNIIQRFVDENGNKLLDDTSTGNYVAESAYIRTNHPTRITKDGIVYGLVKTENPLPLENVNYGTEVHTNDFGTNPSDSITVLVPHGDATITYIYKVLKGTVIQHFVDTTGKKLIDDSIYLDKPVDETVSLYHPNSIEDGVDTYVFVRQDKDDVTKIPEGTTEITYIYEKSVHEVPGDAPQVDIPEAKATVYVDESGNNVKTPDEGLHDGPKVIEDKWQYVKTIPEKDGILTHVYTQITHEIPGDAPQTDIPEAKATVYINEHGETVKTPDEGLHDGPKVIDDKWEYVRTIPEKDGILTHVYTKITSEIPNDAPQTDIPELEATRYVSDKGEELKDTEEGTKDAPAVLKDKWQYDHTEPKKDGITTHVYVEIKHEIPNDAPQTDIPEAKATVYVDESGNNVKIPDEGLHDGPKVIDDKWQYVKTIPEKDGILTHVYTQITSEIPNDAPKVDIPEAKATVYVDESGNNVKIPDEGLHDGPKIIDDKWQYVKTIPEKDGILTHVYTEIKHEIPGDAPKYDIPEAKATVYINEAGETVKTPDEGLHDGPKVIDDKWQYVKTIPEKDGILTHVYTTITSEIPNNPPVVEIPELEITRYVDEHGKDIKDPEPGNKEAPKTIGKYEFSRTIPKKDGVTTHVYKEIPKETPNKPTPNTDKQIPNKPVDKTPKVEQPVTETVVTPQETVTNTVQNVPATTNELPHTGDNDSSKALAVSGLAMFMAGIIGVFRKKKQ